MKINGLIDSPKWKGIPCKCNHDSIETEYPISECLHCKCQEQEDSMPRENFTVDDSIVNQETGEVTKKQTKTVKEITIVRGKVLEDILGWTY